MTAAAAVVLAASVPDVELTALAEEASALAGRDVADAVTWIAGSATAWPHPGAGATARRWEMLATVAAQDLTVARAVEPHLDALAILHEAGEEVSPERTWGVYAAEGPPPRLEARVGAGSTDGWTLSGRKPWCSLAGTVSHALVTAWVQTDRRGLFAVDLDQPGVRIEDGPWSPRGLVAITSQAVLMDDASAQPVGGAGWYLDRPGFAWGGIGVAAVWYGGAVAVARRLAEAVQARDPDQVALMHLGVVDTALTSARAVLSQAAALVDSGSVTGDQANLLAGRVRNVVAAAAETVLSEVAHALGPAPLCQDEDHARRVADLSIYVRQHHAARDAVATGRDLAALAAAGSPW